MLEVNKGPVIIAGLATPLFMCYYLSPLELLAESIASHQYNRTIRNQL